MRLRAWIAVYLAGRNAERAFFGENSTGCSGDFAKAKDLAKSMVFDFGMGVLGKTRPKEIMMEADVTATKPHNFSKLNHWFSYSPPSAW